MNMFLKKIKRKKYLKILMQIKNLNYNFFPKTVALLVFTCKIDLSFHDLKVDLNY